MTLFEYVIGFTGLVAFAASHLLIGIMQMRRRVRQSQKARLSLRHN